MRLAEAVLFDGEKAAIDAFVARYRQRSRERDAEDRGAAARGARCAGW